MCKYGSLGDVLRGKQSQVVGAQEFVSGNLHLSKPDLLYLALGCARYVVLYVLFGLVIIVELLLYTRIKVFAIGMSSPSIS